MSVREDFDSHWQSCDICHGASSVEGLCEIGRKMTELMQMLGSGHASPAPVQTREIVPTIQLDEGTMNAIALRVSRVVGASHGIARSTLSGARVPVPFEKTTGGGVSFRSAPHAVLHVPERDMEIYARIQAAIPAIAALAEDLNAFMAVDEKTRELIRQCRTLAVDLKGEMERRLGS
jgi:hypothetical protein